MRLQLSFAFIVLFFLMSCAPSGGGGGQSRMRMGAGSMSAVTADNCQEGGAIWNTKTEECSVLLAIEEAQTPADCHSAGGFWDPVNLFCSKTEVVGAVLDGVASLSDCGGSGGIWNISTCFISEDDLGDFSFSTNSFSEQDCGTMGGIWANDYCTLPTDPGFAALLAERNPCDTTGSFYNEYLCRNSSQAGCEATLGMWDSATYTCNCESPQTWSDSYLTCDYYEASAISYGDDVMMQIFNAGIDDYASVYVVEVANEWAAHNSWTLRNDMYNSLVASNELAGMPKDANGEDIETKKCYMRFKIFDSENPDSTEAIQNGDLITLSSAGLCDDPEEGHCDIYHNRETSVSMAAAAGIGIGIGIASIAIVAGMIATGGAIAGAVAGVAGASAGMAATAGGGAAAAAAVTATASGTSTAAAVVSSAVATATSAVATSGATAASVAGAAAGSVAGITGMTASTAGATAGATAALSVGAGAGVGMAAVGIAAGALTGVVAAMADWGDLMAHDEYIESDIQLDWSKFTGSDVFRMDIENEAESLMTDPESDGFSLGFHLTTVNTEFEDRDGLYLTVAEEVIRAVDGSGSSDDPLGDEDPPGEIASLRVIPCDSVCQRIEEDLQCWDD